MTGRGQPVFPPAVAMQAMGLPTSFQHGGQFKHRNKIRPPSTVSKTRCEVCNVDTVGEACREAHLKGTKHARMVRAKEALEKMKEDGKQLPADVEPNCVYRCEICAMVLTSTLTMAMHVNGAKHKNAEKEAAEAGKTLNQPGGIVKVEASERTELLRKDHEMHNAAKAAKKAARPVVGTAQAAADSTTTKTEPIEANAESSEVKPESTEMKTESAGAKPESNKPAEQAKKKDSFTCPVCDVPLNSQIQRDEHMKSKKHMERAAGHKVARGRGFGLGFRQARGGGFNAVGGNDAPFSGVPPFGAHGARGDFRGGRGDLRGGRGDFSRGRGDFSRGRGDFSRGRGDFRGGRGDTRGGRGDFRGGRGEPRGGRGDSRGAASAGWGDSRGVGRGASRAAAGAGRGVSRAAASVGRGASRAVASVGRGASRAAASAGRGDSRGGAASAGRGDSRGGSHGTPFTPRGTTSSRGRGTGSVTRGSRGGSSGYTNYNAVAPTASQNQTTVPTVQPGGNMDWSWQPQSNAYSYSTGYGGDQASGYSASNGQATAAQYAGGQYGTSGQYTTGQYDTSGQYNTGQYTTGQYDSAGQYATGGAQFTTQFTQYNTAGYGAAATAANATGAGVATGGHGEAFGGRGALRGTPFTGGNTAATAAAAQYQATYVTPSAYQ